MPQGKALDLAADGITVLLMHPGWVQTDMGGSNAWITAEQAVADMSEVIAQTELAQTGQFWHSNGTQLPW